MRIAGQKPERGQSGAFVNRSSFPGDKVKFKITPEPKFSDPIYDGVSMNQNPGGDRAPVNAWLLYVTSGSSIESGEIKTDIWTESLPSSKQTEDNLLEWTDVVAFPFVDIYISDVFVFGSDLNRHQGDPEYLWPTGASLTNDQIDNLGFYIIKRTHSAGPSPATVDIGFGVTSRSANDYLVDIGVRFKYGEVA